MKRKQNIEEHELLQEMYDEYEDSYHHFRTQKIKRKQEKQKRSNIKKPNKG